MNVTENRSRIAVFIDFDNVEIGVKSTIGGQFDIGLVLEAIKERGEIVTKIAYSDWKRAGDYSRLLTQHAIRMVQRNLTPGGDKNGADITMALDALEMAFTHDHINAFVIVGGDSDFISLVEKLKQYGRRVIVVGGRQFTSMTMQKNCHEFIAYENLVGATRAVRRPERGAKVASADGSDISRVLPLVKRALKVLSEREVTPQLGLLKSTLLQLDSTFSEREYGANSFRDFMEKVAQAGAVSLKHAGRSMLVETVEEGTSADVVATGGDVPEGATQPRHRRDAVSTASSPEVLVSTASRPEVPASTGSPDADEEMPTGPMAMAEGIRAVHAAFSTGTPRWPMYIRQAKQYLKNAVENFDERRYGFHSVVDLLRAAAKEGVVRVERDRHGGMRVFPGANLKGAPVTDASPIAEAEALVDGATAVENMPAFAGEPMIEEVAAEPPIIDADVTPAIELVPPHEQQPRRKRAARKAATPRAKEPRAAKVAKPAKPRARKSTRTKTAEAADQG